MKLVVIQPLLPTYDCEFFNTLQKCFPKLELLVLADIEIKSTLNQYVEENFLFKVSQLKNLAFSGIFLRPGLLGYIRKEHDSAFVFNGNPRDISQLIGMLFLRILGRPFYVWGMFHRIGGPRSGRAGH